MKFSTEENKKEYPKTPPLESNYYEAKCFLIAYIGTQEFKTKEGRPFEVSKVYFGFELEHEKYETGKPRCIYADFRASLVEGTELREIMNNWFGREGKPFDDERAKNFDFKIVVENGIRGRLNVTKYLGKDKKYYNRIDNILPTSLASNLSTPTNPLVIFDANEPVKEEFDKLPKFIKSKVEKTKEWNTMADKMGLIETVTITPEIQKEFGAEANPTPEQQEIINQSSVEDDDLPF